MKKILVITLEYPPHVGGIASYVYNFVSHLPSGEVVVYAPSVSIQDKDYDASNPWKTYRRKPYWLLWPRWFRMFFQLIFLARREKIEEIHVHHVLPTGYVAWLINKLFKIPYIIFFHGSDLQLARLHRPRALKKLCQGSSRIVVNSLFAERLIRSVVENYPPITIIYPSPADSFFGEGVNQETINKIRAELALSGKKILLTVSRLVERKGHAILARLLPRIVEQIPQAVWLIIGDGPEENKVFDIVQKNYLQNSVRFLGALPSEKLLSYYDLADAFVLLTHKDEDGVDEAWGTVFLEAAARGLPVVAGRSGGVEEAVEHLKTGIIVDTHQDKAVVAAIVELFKNFNYAKQMGEEGKARARQEFTWEKQIKKLTINNE